MYRLRREPFLQILSQNEKDYQIFCQLRDEVAIGGKEGL
jgi:hypothetical protein